MVQKEEAKNVKGGAEKETEFIKWFSKTDKGMVSLAGKKGANLGELFSHRIPVPDGFIVTTKAYKNFLKSSGVREKIEELLKGLDFDNSDSVNEFSKKVGDLVKKSEFPEKLKEEIVDSYTVLGANKLEIEKGSARDILNNAAEPTFVSVRSSTPFRASKSSGKREQDTYLNVKGNDEVLEHVKKVFVSLFNPKTMM